MAASALGARIGWFFRVPACMLPPTHANGQSCAMSVVGGINYGPDGVPGVRAGRMVRPWGLRVRDAGRLPSEARAPGAPALLFP